MSTSFINFWLLFIFSYLTVFSCSSSNSLASDAKGNIEITSNRVKGLDISQMEDVVSICYSIWFNQVYRPAFYNISEILKNNPEQPEWGPVHAFHYWAEPELGYYNSDNVKVIKTHMRQLEAAKIDFIILDFTNGLAPMLMKDSEILLNTTKELREAGEDTPHIVFWIQNSPEDRSSNGQKIYDEFVKSKKYEELFVYWEGKPLLITTKDPFDQSDNKLADNFTCRKMWGLQRKLNEKEWSFLQDEPQNVAMNEGKPEQISVSVAHQETYMSYPSATTRRKGKTFQEQWQRAFEIRPKIVTLTWWNEWMAQRFVDENGNTRFVDDYTREASRDIEPMLGGHGDLYYKFMQTYIDKYKAHDEFPSDLLENENYN